MESWRDRQASVATGEPDNVIQATIARLQEMSRRVTAAQNAFDRVAVLLAGPEMAKQQHDRPEAVPFTLHDNLSVLENAIERLVSSLQLLHGGR